ncbi:hypothetical protein ACNQTB_12310, partial [Corynebacterium diphtheriae]
CISWKAFTADVGYRLVADFPAVPGGRDCPSQSAEELEHAITHHDCIVLMKVYGRLQQVRDLLRRHDLFDHAILMADATLETEQCWRRLDEIDDEQTLPYFSTVLINKTRK